MYKYFHKRSGVLAPDLDLWEALGKGSLLTEILSDFYSQVFADERLGHFFEGVTIERAIEKQYSFLRSIFTGEKCYFGDHPKNAHHWMVISNELFDYREALMENTLRRYGLAEHHIKRWMDMEEVFRKAIVKSKPFGRKVGQFEAPFEGYSELKLAVSTLCDECGSEIETGEDVLYHNRTGKVFCTNCCEEMKLSA